MGEHLRTDSRRFSGIVVLLLFCSWAFGSHDWANAESNAATGVIDAVYTSNQDDSWVASNFKGQVNRPLSIHLNLSPYPPPTGAFYTAIVDVLESPEGAKPDIVPGVPDISVRCPKSGTYRLRIRANLIEKSSCALAKAQILKEKEIRLIITP